MKRTIFLLTIMLMALMPLTACNDLNGIQLDENQYDFDITEFVAQNVYVVDNDGTDALPIVVKAPFTCTILANGDLYTCDNSKREQNQFSLSIDETPIVKARGKEGQYTREINTVYIKPFELQKISGYPAGFFAYPIRIRQYGTDGTLYLTADEIRNWKNTGSTAENWPGNYNQRYVLATVKSVGEKYHTNGIHKPNLTIGEAWYVPFKRDYYGKDDLPDLEAIDMVIVTEGEEINVTVHQFACYKLFDNFKVKAGDTIEMNMPNSGIGVDKDNLTTVWVSPQDIIVK